MRKRWQRYVQLQIALHGPQRYRSRDHAVARYSVVSTDPPIFYAGHGIDDRLRINESREELQRYLRSRRAYFLYAWAWTTEPPGRLQLARLSEGKQRRRYPEHRYVHLCNTPRELELFAGEGLEAVLCSTNALIDERVFRPLPGVPKPYDAVYDTRLNPYKRHFLATEIESLARIYTTSPDYDEASPAASPTSGRTSSSTSS